MIAIRCVMVVQGHMPVIVTAAAQMHICIWDTAHVSMDTMAITVVTPILPDLCTITEAAAQHVPEIATDQMHVTVNLVVHICTSTTGDTVSVMMATSDTAAHVMDTDTLFTLMHVIQYVALHAMDQRPVTVMNVAIMHTRTRMDTVHVSTDTMETIVT